MKKDHSWTLRYTLINVTYFIAFCTIHAYAAVYLLDRGFTNTQIGILLALSNVVSAILQPLVAAIIDKQGFFTNRNVMMICAALIAAGSLLLLFADSVKAVVFIVFSFIYMVQFTYMPVMTALNFEYKRAGIDIFYGLARGLGSAGFAITSAIIGRVIEMRGVRVLLYCNVVIMLVQFVIVWFFRLPEKTSETVGGSDQDEKKISETDINGDMATDPVRADKQENSNIIQFFRKYPAFMILIIATVLLFFTHNMLNDYLIQIIRPLGGTESNMGVATFIAAMLELPTMAVITLISGKVSKRLLLTIAGVSFTIKALIMMFAVNIPMAYLSQAMQMFAYAVFIPASAYYVSETISEHDQVKGQAFVTSSFTLAGVFSSLICGVILDRFGEGTMLIVGSVVSVIGTLTLIGAMLKDKKTVSVL